MTDDADIRMAQSMMDYIFRRLALDYLPFDSRSAMGIHTATERSRALETGDYTPDFDSALTTAAQSASVVQVVAASVAVAKPVEVKIDSAPVQIGSSTELFEAMTGIKSDAPLCMSCGVKMRMAGSCFVCEGCGSTSGCS
jgi:ribonucleoside-diphosphate reductase alpha chain